MINKKNNSELRDNNFTQQSVPNQAGDTRDVQIANLLHAVAERDGRIEDYENTVRARDEGITWLRNEMNVLRQRFEQRRNSFKYLFVDFLFLVARRFPYTVTVAHVVLPDGMKRRLQARNFQNSFPAGIHTQDGLAVDGLVKQHLKNPPPYPVLSTAAGCESRNENMDMICFANIEWSARYQRPQQLMSQFAKHGYRVFYVIASKLPPAGHAYMISQVAENVFEVALEAYSVQNFYRDGMTDQNREFFVRSLDALIRDYRIKTALSVVHLPYWGPLTRLLRQLHGWRIQYDCMDEWMDFPHIGNALLDEEKRLVQEADLVTVTATVLYEKWSVYASNCLLVRNGVDYRFFLQNCIPNKLLAELAQPIIGFYGGLAEWVDFNLIAYLADQRPKWTFVLIGDVFVEDVAGLDAKPNVHLLGRRPYADMPRYLYHFNVCLIPFRIYNVTHAVDPVKFYEFMSAGKPVVSVPLEEMKIYRDYVYFASKPQDFLSQLETALAENDIDAVNKRIELARENDWNNRYEITCEAIKALHKKLSIIVVTYNNIGLTQRCVASLLRNTTYPNYEIIVVDNASADDTRNYLHFINRNHLNIRIIFNNENVGFAAANNQGLRVAEGEYIVLLNNDTVLPKGWADALLRHLEDPTIGLVGPVTNSAGNEACIEVDYQDIEQMEAFADSQTAQHAGQAFDIPMLAMFCVAMRRDVFEQIGFLDEAFGIGMFEDDDYSRRIHQAGYRIVCAEDAFVHHYGQASFKKLIDSGEYQKLWDKNQSYFESKWGKWTPHSHRNSRSELNRER